MSKKQIEFVEKTEPGAIRLKPFARVENGMAAFGVTDISDNEDWYIGFVCENGTLSLNNDLPNYLGLAIDKTGRITIAE